jgi:hypothetical protein
VGAVSAPDRRIENKTVVLRQQSVLRSWACTASRTPATSFRGLQQFFPWLAAEDEIPDPMVRLRPHSAGQHT